MKKYIIVSIVSMAIGALISSQLFTPKTVTKTETVEKEKIKTVVVKEPGGKEVTTRVEYRDKTSEAVKTEPVLRPKPDYSLGLSYNTRAEYEASVGRRMLGDLWLEAKASQTGVLSIGVRYEF